jgi:putative ABC transport system permease protein
MATSVSKSRLLPADVARVGSIGLRTRRLRAALSAIGIAIGIASMVAVLGISESSKSELVSKLDRLGTNLLEVGAGQGLFGASDGLSSEATLVVSRIGPVEQVASVGTVPANVYRTDAIPEEETNGIGVVATELDLLETLGATMASGRFLNAATAETPAVVLGFIAAERLGISGPGEGVIVWLGDEWFSVVGVLDFVELAPAIDRAAMIGYPIANTLFGVDGQPSTIYVRSDPETIEAVSEVLPASINPEAPEEVEVSRPSDALEARAAVNDALTALLVGLGAVALLVGGVGIANVMVISVLERRQEIGLRRALGATKRHISGQFLTESLILAAVGGLVGVILGSVVTVAYAGTQEWDAVVPLYGLVGGIGAALAIGAVAGLYPAVRAAKLAPTEALRSV